MAAARKTTRETPETGLSAEEKEALKERAAETRTRKGRTTPEQDAAEVLAKIAAMAPADRAIAERVHEVVTAAGPDLAPKTWYGMPAYFKSGKVVCFFQDGGKFKSRYCTFGFQDSAALDDGSMWPTSFAITEVTPAVAEQIRALVQRAVG